MALKKEKVVGCVIYRNDPEDDVRKYLVIKKFKGFWEFPKGHPEAGENAKETIKREVKEETGLINFSFKQGFMEKIGYIAETEEGKFDRTVIYFLGITKQTKILLSDEHLDYRWLGYKEAREKLTFDSLKELLDKAEEFLSKK